MKRLLWLFSLAAVAALPLPASAQTSHSKYDGLIATHARDNLVPEELVHRVIVRESKYQPSLVGRGGAIGLMQINARDRPQPRLHRKPPKGCATPRPTSNMR